jgi:hypothetical protein
MASLEIDLILMEYIDSFLSCFFILVSFLGFVTILKGTVSPSWRWATLLDVSRVSDKINVEMENNSPCLPCLLFLLFKNMKIGDNSENHPILPF